MNREITILHTIADIHPESGGISRVVVDLVDALEAQALIHPVLITQSLIGEPTIHSSNPKVRRIITVANSQNSFSLGLPFRSALRTAVNGFETSLIHNHGLWRPVNYWACRVARERDIAIIIQPHGMLEEWALNYHRWKKQLALNLYQRRDLETATLFFATAEQEADSIRRLGLRQPIAIIPNGVELPMVKPNLSKAKEQSFGKYTALFLSRIHPKKGILNLIEAWARLRPMDWCLRIAGPDEGGHLAEVMGRVRALGLEKSIEYVGQVGGDAKAALFENADLFILPSFSENFGVVIAEALAHGVPVITTCGTPWKGLLDHGCGWWIEPTADALIEAFQEAMNMNPASLQAMGEKGREYAREFDWSHIAQETADVYRWVLGQGPIPECVVRD